MSDSEILVPGFHLRSHSSYLIVFALYRSPSFQPTSELQLQKNYFQVRFTYVHKHMNICKDIYAALCIITLYTKDSIIKLSSNLYLG